MHRFSVRHTVVVFAAAVSFHFISCHLILAKNLLLVDSAVGIASDYGQENQGVGVRVPIEAEFLLSTSSILVLGPTQPPIQWILRSLSLAVQRPGHEADHSPTTIAEVKYTWIYNPLPYTSSWHSA
jgi:hypothetical protein